MSIHLPFNLNGVEAIFFDFDGVLVESVSIKLAAYQEIFKPFGHSAVEEIIKYHIENGGIDRYRKIEFILKKFSLSLSLVNSLADQFSNLVKQKVILSPAIPEMIELAVEFYKKIPVFIVSGTPEVELQEIVEKRNWVQYFKEVKGSPSTKPEITFQLLEKYGLNSYKCVFIGDANTDFQTARECKTWFLGVPY